MEKFCAQACSEFAVIIQPLPHITTSKINAFDIICELVTDSSIAKILHPQKNSVLQYSNGSPDNSSNTQ